MNRQKEIRRLKQMGKDIVLVEYDGYNRITKYCLKSYKEKMFDAFIIRDGYSQINFDDMTKKEVENRDKKWEIVWREISFLMFRNIAFECCLNGNFACDSERNVEHLILELKQIDEQVKDYEWEETKN